MHDMGNSDGGMKSYIKLIDEYPQYLGGFIWDFIDQALLTYDPISGKKYSDTVVTLMIDTQIMSFLGMV